MNKYRWTIHNIIGHPLSEILHLLGCTKASVWVHDVTDPTTVTGGTRTAVEVAKLHNIPVFNLAHTPHLERLQRFLEAA